MSAVWLTLAVVFCLVGVVGLIAPALPGLPLIFVGVWLMALSDDYQVIGPGSLIVFFVLCSVGVALDYVAGMMGAKFSGASKKAYWGAGSSACSWVCPGFSWARRSGPWLARS